MSIVTNNKNCYCHTCKKAFHYLGISRHRAMHRSKKENCEILYTNGDTFLHKYKDHNHKRTEVV
jgi:hypothetical protein